MASVPLRLHRRPARLRCPLWPPVHPRSPPPSLQFVLIRPFPPPQGSDTIPIAHRPAVQFNAFYPAGPSVRLLGCAPRGPPDKSLFVRRIEAMKDEELPCNCAQEDVLVQ